MTRLRLLKVYSDHYYNDLDTEKEDYYGDVMKHASKMQLGWGFKFPSYELRYLCWDGYPLDFLPSNFDGGKLVELHLHYSNIKQLWLGKVLLSFNNEFFFFVLILKFMIVTSLLTLIFFLYSILKG